MSEEIENSYSCYTIGEGLDNNLELLRDHKPCIARVSWGTDKGPYIFAFESSVDANYCECNAHEFKILDPLTVVKNHKRIPIWEVGAKTEDQVSLLRRIDMEKYIEKNVPIKKRGGNKK